jgi:two-component system, OmpR family, sensor histidine kinase ChvG
VPDAIAQLLDKLIENANDFAPREGAIRVSLAAAAGARCASLAVENDGPALPQSMVNRLFDSMVSLRSPQPAREGGHLGLGLYIVRLVAEHHGGNVRAMNLAGEGGARFEVEFLLP